MRQTHTVQSLRHKYELEIQSIESNMPHYEKWGSDRYYNHRLSLYKRFVSELAIIEREEAKQDGV